MTSYRHLALLLILPAIQITFYTGTVGSDVKDVKLLFDNNDTGKGLSVRLCVLSPLNSSTLTSGLIVGLLQFSLLPSPPDGTIIVPL